MIWYLLCPFRRTSEPPQLPANHPIRRTFYRLGTLIARHWLASIVFSVAVGVTLCYPSVFLYTNPTAGFTSKIPHHVWASARLFDNSLEKQPDVEVRQVWIHGSYMKALDPGVLLQALDIQNALLRDGFHDPLDTEDEEQEQAAGFPDCGDSLDEAATWGIHSPLMYWNCSANLIRSDNHTTSTIDDQAQRKSYMNLTLRPHSVFAGKSFVNGNITAADALVLTFFDRADAVAGHEWDRRVISLAKRSSPGQTWYLPDEDGSNHLYEFEFKPMTFNDAVVLLLCYVVMTAYLVTSLRRTRAVKSTLGLGLTIITELTVSIVASLTICGILNIDLSLIPREVYPFVVFAIGLENMFRITNAVVGTPATMPTVQRIGTALGEVGHLSLAVAAQNLGLLWMLSKLVAPSVQAFCAFAAIALIVDFFMHFSFFIAVLSVDVQRLELQDSLDRLNSATSRTKSPHRPDRQTWYDALRQGKLPFSTRVAGTAVMFSFIVALNWHFFDNMSLLQMLQTMRPGRRKAGILFSSTTLPPINARRSPGAWLRMQNQQTAEEVIQFVKPKVPSFTARIHQPIAVVLQDADRGGVTPRTETVLAIVHDVLDAHLIPYALTVVIIVAITTILMNYLLWNELSENDGFDGGDEEEETLRVSRLWRSHEHDIIRVFTNGRHILSLSSEKLITATVWDSKLNAYVSRVLLIEAVSPTLWPISSAAIDESGTWSAVYAKDGRVGFWFVGERRFRHIVRTPLHDRTTVMSAFLPSFATENGQPHYLLLTTDGSLTGFAISDQVSVVSSIIFTVAPMYACLLPQAKGQSCISVLSRDGKLNMAMKENTTWTAQEISNADEPNGLAISPTMKGMCVLEQLRCLAVYQDSTVRLISANNAQHVLTMKLPCPIKRASLQFLHPPHRECPNCHGPATHALVLTFIDPDTEDCVMLTYKLAGEASLICFSPLSMRSKAACGSIEQATVASQTVGNPGSWVSTEMQSIIGVRKIDASINSDSDSEVMEEERAMSTASDVPLTSITSDNRARSRRPSHLDISLRSRRHDSPGPFSIGNSGLEDWQIWTLASGGELQTIPLTHTPIRCAQASVMGLHEHQQLYAAAVGPVRRHGTRSAAIALANTIFIVTLGGERRLSKPSENGLEHTVTSTAGWRARGRERDTAGHRRHND